MDNGPGERRGDAWGFVAGLVVGGLAAAAARNVPAWRRDPNRPVRVLYNLIAPIYDFWGGAYGPLAPLRQELVELLSIGPGQTVLEVSVGTGANLPHLCAKVGPTGRIFGLDISEGMLEQAQRKLSGVPCPVELRLGLAEDLPYADDDFDAVLCVGGINAFTDRRRALQEMNRVARPGARVVVADETLPEAGGPAAPVFRWILARAPRLRPPVELAPHPSPEIHRLAGGYIYALVWEKMKPSEATPPATAEPG